MHPLHPAVSRGELTSIFFQPDPSLCSRREGVWVWGGLPVSEMVSQTRGRDTGKAGTRQAAGSGRRRNL